MLCLHGFSRYCALVPPAAAGVGQGRLPRRQRHPARGYEPASIPADGRYSLDIIAGDIVAAVDELGAAQAHLVGTIGGAAIAYTAAASAPERFSA